ncbi:MAG: TIM barrel protein [Verrucomicrobiota bacterium]|nr:TIM barrel protein [Verrucomicrobiota bacterium]
MKTTRRTAIKSAAGSTLAIAGLSATSTQAQAPKGKANPKFRVKNGRIKQSIMGWTFKPMPVPELARLSKEVGLVAMEGISRDHYPLLKKLDLDVSLLGSHGFKKGPVDPKNHDECLAKLTEAIEVCAGAGYKRVITFTGMKAEGIDDEQAEKNCIKLWKKVLPLAEKKKVTLCLEHLNSRDDSHPMKGHPGYFGDDVDHCVKMIEKIGSPSFKLLFDVYHVQIMNGDVIRRIRQYKDFIGHYHVAGNPGRAELDDKQEINYPPVMNTILETGFDGYVAHEFIPTWEDKALALRHAAQILDV